MSQSYNNTLKGILKAIYSKKDGEKHEEKWSMGVS